MNADDVVYVVDNPHVQSGLNAGNIEWAFTSQAAGNWVPVTMLSHMVGVELFDLRSGMHHLLNVVFHAIATVLLFVVLKRATKARWPSAFVAAVFALHPLHVESVAWISERKDVLCALFWFLTLYCYIRYAERPSAGRYFVVLGAFGLGLMSKPMTVTLPFVLLLFDVWPLRRVQLPRTIWEKTPMLALAVADSVVTWVVQRDNGAFLSPFTLPTRIETALVSYVTYLRQTIWPTRLAVFYPYPLHGPGIERAIASCIILLALSWLLIWRYRRYPYCRVGWLWFLGTLVPVIGLKQIGGQSHADRYTYIPMVGLLIVLAWGAADFIKRRSRIKPLMATAAGILCLLLSAVSWRQIGYWRNDGTLNQHAIDVVQGNAFAHNNLASYLEANHRVGEALWHVEEAVRIQPDYPSALQHLGLLKARAGLYSAAIPHFEAALRSNPRMVEAGANLGWCLVEVERYREAVPYLEKAVRERPASFDLHFLLARALRHIAGREQDAVHEYEGALKIRPDSPEIHRQLGMLLASLGHGPEAIAHLEVAFQISPDPETEEIIKRLRKGPR